MYTRLLQCAKILTDHDHIIKNIIEYFFYPLENLPGYIFGGCCGRDPKVVGFTTTYANSAFHH